MTQPWYPFYWADYISKTYHLTQGQHGAYILLLCYVYNTGKSISSKQCYSIALANTEQERSNVDFVLAAFFVKKGDEYTNDRALDVIKSSEKAHQRKVEAGRIGGMSKSSSARALLKQPQPQPQSYKKEKINKKEKFTLPEWVPLKEWEAWMQVRVKKQAAQTVYALELAVSKLEKLQNAGHSPVEVLNQSIMRSYTGLFEVKPTGEKNGKSKLESAIEATARARAAREQRETGDIG